MQNSFDAVIIGAGPAGCSAALTLHMRGKSVAVVSNDPKNSPLARAERVSNYPGTGVISGAGLVSNMLLHLAALDIPLLIGRVISALPVGKGFGVSYGAEYLSCAALVICSGAAQKSFLPGERELLGRGVSYCATCDGMLYRQRRVVVLGFSEDSAEETNFLRGIGCDVAYFDRQSAKQYEIAGVSRVEALIADGISHPCDGVFILRDTVAADVMLSGLETKDGFIAVSQDMSASIRGVFAAGDCVGKPYQIAKAAGEGNIAALSAAAYLDGLKG